MAGHDNETATVLATLKGWQWGHFDPDGVLLGLTIELCEVVNRLAFHGHDNPAKAVLALLCDGKLTAICDFQWLKYRHGQRFHMSENMGSLGRDKWTTLAQLLAETDQALVENDSSLLKTDLDELELKDCDTADWTPEYNRCSYAICPPETGNQDPKYFEESFTATGIEIMLAASEFKAFNNPYIQNDVGEFGADGANKEQGSKAPLSEANLQKWWSSKAGVRKMLTKDELLALVRSKYPDNHISRERVRDLVGARKRGPKGIGG